MAQTDGRCCSAIRPHYPVGNYMYMYIRVNIQHAYNVCIHVHFEYVQCTMYAMCLHSVYTCHQLECDNSPVVTMQVLHAMAASSAAEC